MSFLIIDTETNGLMDYKRPADAEGQPRVAEFAGILVTDRGDVELEFQRYIKPPMTDGEPAWVMTEDTTKVNGITNEMLWNQGVPINEVLNWYQAQIIAGRTVVAFGAQYDCKMMRSELRRANRDDLFEHTPNICLMRECRAWAKSLGREIIKAGGSQKGWPKLTDLADFCGAIYDPKQMHGALMDARLKAVCFRYMLDNGFEAVGRVHHAKDYDAIKNAS